MARVQVPVQTLLVAPNVYHLISGAPGVSFPDCSAHSLLLCSYCCRAPVPVLVQAVRVCRLRAQSRYLLFIGWQSSSSFAAQVSCLFALHQGLDKRVQTDRFARNGKIAGRSRYEEQTPEGFCGLRQSPYLWLYVSTVDAEAVKENK